jgi:hypothetical protein
MLWLFLILLLIVVSGYWLVRRADRPPADPDLRRADDAESAGMPSADEVRDRISESFGETRPPGY